LALELHVRAAGFRRRRRNSDLGQDLVLAEGRLEETREERVDRDRPLALLPGRHDDRADREHRGRMIVRRVAMRQVPADGREVAHDRVGDDTSRVGEDRVLLVDQLRALEGGLARSPADLQEASVLLDVLETRYAVDVDEMSGRTE